MKYRVLEMSMFRGDRKPIRETTYGKFGKGREHFFTNLAYVLLNFGRLQEEETLDDYEILLREEKGSDKDFDEMRLIYRVSTTYDDLSDILVLGILAENKQGIQRYIKRYPIE